MFVAKVTKGHKWTVYSDFPFASMSSPDDFQVFHFCCGDINYYELFLGRHMQYMIANFFCTLVRIEEREKERIKEGNTNNFDHLLIFRNFYFFFEFSCAFCLIHLGLTYIVQTHKSGHGH